MPEDRKPRHDRSRAECDPRPGADGDCRRWFNELQQVSTSPANILRSGARGRPEVKLVDLGIALVNGNDWLTATGLLLGTPSYLAPEQAQGATADARSDLYALGAMLYEWVVGEPPFVAGDAMAVIAQHVHAAPARPGKRRPELPAALKTLILRLLAKDTAARPESAAEVRDEPAGLLA